MRIRRSTGNYAARYNYWAREAHNAGYNEKIMAQRCRITIRQLQRIFKRDLGCGPEQWLMTLRLLDAKYLLMESKGIKQVAMELGFKQESHFFHRFKELYGITPSRFLKQVKRGRDVAVEQQLSLPGTTEPLPGFKPI